MPYVSSLISIPTINSGVKKQMNESRKTFNENQITSKNRNALITFRVFF